MTEADGREGQAWRVMFDNNDGKPWWTRKVLLPSETDLLEVEHVSTYLNALEAQVEELTRERDAAKGLIALYGSPLANLTRAESAEAQAAALRAKAALSDWLRERLRHTGAGGNFVGGDALMEALDFVHSYDALATNTAEEGKDG